MFAFNKVIEIFRGPKRPTTIHANTDSVSVETIPPDSDLIREGSGTTTITGKIEYVHVTVRGSASLRIEGEVGRGCTFYKDGNGTLRFAGTVANDLKLTVFGQGNIVFTQEPPQTVINSIENPIGNAQITCAGRVLPQFQPGYRRHNLGFPFPAEQAAPVQFRQTSVALSRLSTERPQQASTAEDDFNSGTKIYIERYKTRETIADIIERLNLTPEEEPLFKRFEDTIYRTYLDDVPLRYGNAFYGKANLLAWYKINKTDPATRDPVKLDAYSPGDCLYGELNDVIVELNKMRAAKQEAAAVELSAPALQDTSEEQSSEGLSMSFQ
ncbi:hypothetical protein Lqui_0077 [Legionella quinlivanii]|uniref:Uncharacterized protein n=1 Tax=Legionella quinlivanii TaxID=45073 RepID=A0A0W0Y790_9GAMM|nr:hypothetical protein [Legionella quinlivanii]KTD52624.1 hypothetical protein Lqui_0077 [Legionella quinlivanii]SEG26161.1 hypothetical protein SAMN02746093_02349 [Legionella quinlivanii DSM 21216]STY10304.1 Uncharacterised protein [Legionella quinlivanii]